MKTPSNNWSSFIPWTYFVDKKKQVQPLDRYTMLEEAEGGCRQPREKFSLV